MSTIAISYKDLRNASSEASTVAKKLSSYADEIKKNVIKKLDNYSGDRSSNISIAYSSATTKYRTLTDAKEQYTKYSSNLKNLCEDCKTTDKNVANRIHTLTGTFRETHGIDNGFWSQAEQWIAYQFTSFTNSTPAFRWIDNNVVTPFSQKVDELKGNIKEWYDFGGGKQLVKGIGEALFTIVGAVAAIVIGVLTFPVSGVFAIVAAVAGLVVAGIALLDGTMDLVNECVAYNMRQNGDASMGYRLSNLNSFTDTVRTFSDNKIDHMFANVLDGVEFVCGVIDAIKDIQELGKFLKGGGEWIKNTWANLKDLKNRGLLTQTLGEGLVNGKNKIVQMSKEIFSSIKSMDIDYFGKVVGDSISDFAKTMEYTFDTSLTDLAEITENQGNVVKNWIELGEAIWKGELGEKGFESIRDFALKKIEVFDVSLGDIADMVIDFTDWCTEDDRLSNIVKMFDGSNQINVSVPQIHMPQINIDININVPNVDIPKVSAA